jgi:diketogulonate reductase-like aldo/keto reductase
MNVPMIKLNNKLQIPQLGFGTWMLKDKDQCMQAVQAALNCGYRHIDTAQIYENEEFVGEAIAKSGISRDQIFLTTKIWNDNQFWDDLTPSFETSLKKLGTDYVDLLLLHFPVTELRRPAWTLMQDIQKTGKAKSIGVSNYTKSHLEELLSECKIKPVVNQVELHVFLHQPELVEYCQANDIILEAYSPLAHGYRMDNDTIKNIAKKHGKSYAQIMVRWCIEKGFVVLPKSAHKDRIEENMKVFDFNLDDQDMNDINKLNEGLRTCWDPTHVS